jgi:GNAT superfamily N-acetyltransferase
MNPAHRQATFPQIPAFSLRELDIRELAAINAVIEAAIETWDIAPRVKRLALSSYRYESEDFDHLDFVGALVDGRLAGILALEPAAATVGTEGPMLVHGLYVEPPMHGTGIGSALVDAAKRVARERGSTGLLVRAERNARTFFAHLGFAPLPVADAQRDYPHRLFLPLDKAPA